MTYQDQASPERLGITDAARVEDVKFALKRLTTEVDDLIPRATIIRKLATHKDSDQLEGGPEARRTMSELATVLVELAKVKEIFEETLFPTETQRP